MLQKSLSFTSWLMVFFCWLPLTSHAVSPSFAEVDLDMNGRLSKKEVAQLEELDFAEADENQDGALNLEEYVTGTTKTRNKFNNQ